MRDRSFARLPSDRVAYTETLNLPTAVRVMAYTAMHQDEIKARAGTSTKGARLRGGSSGNQRLPLLDERDLVSSNAPA